MQIVLLIGLIVIASGLLYTFFKLRRNDFTLLANYNAKRIRKRFRVIQYCPLCGRLMEGRNQLHIVAAESPHTTPHEGTKNVILYGCDQCDPHDVHSKHPPKRTCPVCSIELDTTASVIARLSIDTSNEKAHRHIHIVGCTACTIDSKNVQ